MASGLRKKGKDTRSELEIMTEERDEAKANWDKAISERNQALDFEIHCCRRMYYCRSVFAFYQYCLSFCPVFCQIFRQFLRLSLNILDIVSTQSISFIF